MAFVTAPGSLAVAGSKPSVIVKKGNGATIQKAIDSLPSTGGEVVIQPGTFGCANPIVIARDNVELRGAGPSTILRLNDGANAPVLVLGQTAAVPLVTNRNIHVSNLLIDGNRANQSSETWGVVPAIRNNGIALRTVSDVVVQQVIVKSARSGGLVSELGCRRVTVRDFISYDNHFDGLAGYQTENSVFTDLYLHDNGAAGFSFDIQFNNNLLNDVVIVASGTVGVFMRDSRDNVFHGFQIRDSGQHGIFLAQVDLDTTKPASGNTFNAVAISGSAQAGIRVNDDSCTNNLAVGCQFIGNAAGCVSEASSGLLVQSGNVCR
jgi:hypothetical protein